MASEAAAAAAAAAAATMVGISTISEPGGVVVVDVPRPASPPAPQDAASPAAAAAAAAAGCQKAVVKLYRHDCADNACPTRWSRQRTVEDENKELRKSVAQVPIVHRQVKRRGGKWVTHNFTVHNAQMRAVLARALARYQDFHPEMEDWTFAKPFQPLVHRWETLREIQAEVAAEAEAVQLANREADTAAGASTQPDRQEAEVHAQQAERERQAVARRELVDEMMAFLTPLMAPAIAARDQTVQTGKVEFKDVWQVFPPGALVVAKFYGVDAVCRVAKYEKLRSKMAGGVGGQAMTEYWCITSEYVDWNGESCGFEKTRSNILDFDGFRTVQSFPIIPLGMHPEVDQLKARLIARGRKFESLRGYHYRVCEGTKITLEDMESGEQKPATGRIVIDAFAYYYSCNKTPPKLEPLKEKTDAGKLSGLSLGLGGQDDDSSSSSSSTSTSSSGSTSIVDDDDIPRPQQMPVGRPVGVPHPRPMPQGHPVRGMPSMGRGPPPGIPMGRGGPPPRPGVGRGPPPGHHPGMMPPNVVHVGPGPLIVEGTDLTATPSQSQRAGKRNEDLTPLTDEECLLATPWVMGFELKAKEWGLFNVEEIEDVVWNDEAFDNLVLPNESKELAWAFVESKGLDKSSFDDFVENKGRGLIILMFGPPGVGKTYTAEAVAERSRVPLYSMSAAVLGTNPRSVEYQLDRALDLCRLWKAMLLLDEADIFLSARDNLNLARNELIAVFLTKLEYYQGTLFMTTNRISALDHAFQSRVDLLLPYHELTVAARRRIWENFVAHLGKDRFEVVQDDLDMLSQISLNGREIKNLIKSAGLLSARGGEKISASRLLMLAEGRVKALELLRESDYAD